MPKYNIEKLANIHQYHDKVAQTVDDADWLVSDTRDEGVLTMEDEEKGVDKHVSSS